ncbi:hypothetical protein CSOJ01_06203 [Colletotrichum sojae]|uniref:Ribosomal RNA methyltransferase FtsJ domain-containing protein n=1 Tax=Colletotrichum sojae TaxID=2175907 RepID=A0A8H6JD02_9PEZI|nr:hypothetical protein CSOJ01_06203 [Colletotrichum sojae]
MPGTMQVPVGASDDDTRDDHGLDGMGSLFISADGIDNSAPREPRTVVVEYLIEHCPQDGENPAGDQFFQEQRRTATEPSMNQEKYFFRLMKDVGRQLNNATGVLKIRAKPPARPRILDIGMAPGGFFAAALELNRNAQAVGLTLPISEGGYGSHVPASPDVDVRYLDITMLAADLGVGDIPAECVQPREFLPRQLEPGREFDLVICGGSVVHQHQGPGSREPIRLSMSQQALGLEHLAPGGTMVVLMHKLDAWEAVYMIYTFDKFSKVRLFKPPKAHAKRSSFYMIATGVRSGAGDPEAPEAIKLWRKRWKRSFYTDAESEKINRDEEEPLAEEVLKDFGGDLVRMGRKVWEIQAEALKNAPFIQN